MSIKSQALAAIMLIATPAAAMAAAPPITVTLTGAVEKPAKLIFANGAFECKETTCVSLSDATLIEELRACKQIAKKYGAVSEVAAGEQKFDEARLAKCNASAKK